jgi:hypothetical protein
MDIKILPLDEANQKDPCVEAYKLGDIFTVACFHSGIPPALAGRLPP